MQYKGINNDNKLIEILESIADRLHSLDESVSNIEVPEVVDLVQVNFRAADYTALGPMTWTVTANGFDYLAYSRQGNMMEVSWEINGPLGANSVLGGTATAEARIQIPALRDALGSVAIAYKGSHEYNDGAFGSGEAVVFPGTTYITLFKAARAVYTLGNFFTLGSIRFPVNLNYNVDE